MNQNTVSGNLDRIKRATDDMRLITGTTGEDIETVAQAVSNLNDDNLAKDETIAELEQEIEDITPKGSIDINDNGTINVASYQYANVNVSGGSGGDNDIHHVNTIEEMNALIGRRGATAKEGDLCVVLSGGAGGICDGNTIRNIIISPSVVLDEPFSGEYTQIEFELDGGYGMLSISEDSMYFNMEYRIGSGFAEKRYGISVVYTSDDGVHYQNVEHINNIWTRIRQSSEIIPFDEIYPLNIEINIVDLILEGYQLDERIVEFCDKGIQYSDVDFNGLFTCKNNQWEPTKIGIATTANSVANGKIVYTNAGKITGNLGSDWTEKISITTLLDIENGAVDGIDITDYKSTYEGDPWEGSPFRNTNYKYMPIAPYLDLGQETNLKSFFGNNAKLKKLDLTSWDFTNRNTLCSLVSGCSSLDKIKFPSRVFNLGDNVNLQSMFALCSNLTELDLSWMTVNSWSTDVYACSTAMSQMFWMCDKLEKVDIRNLEIPEPLNNYNSPLFGEGKTPSTNCILIVKDQANKERLLRVDRYLTSANIKTVEEYEGGNE